MRILLAILLLALGAAQSCKKTDYLSDDEQQRLFADPRVAELEAVRADWQSRDLNPSDFEVLGEYPLRAGAFVLRMVGFRVQGLQEYGALIVPNGGSGLPVHMYINGFGLGYRTNSINVAMDTSAAGRSSILAIPALRGQSLSLIIDGQTYTSPQSGGEHCDAFDGATDDALGFLNVIQAEEARADVQRTAFRGGSRGGTVAMLAGIRDKRVKRVAGIVSPTDMLMLTAANTSDETYQCQCLSAFRSGQSDAAATRKKMIASSPLYFAADLPPAQLHLGRKDSKVPLSQGLSLEQRLAKLGRSRQFELFSYDRGHEDIATDNPELAQRVNAFLAGL